MWLAVQSQPPGSIRGKSGIAEQTSMITVLHLDRGRDLASLGSVRHFALEFKGSALGGVLLEGLLRIGSPLQQWIQQQLSDDLQEAEVVKDTNEELESIMTAWQAMTQESALTECPGSRDPKGCGNRGCEPVATRAVMDTW
ncbi:hypothetical protein BSKO_07235 [Bryopsis sp. KO-2023]|nr:hypothetical protein BSKO_07235 [Bryopsis sp. KO-2023]